MGRATVLPGGSGGSHAINIVDVEVDPETGKVQVTRLTALADVGNAVHPGYVEGQMQGGAAQGIGWALNEEYVYDDAGRMVNASFLDYRMPTSLDLPRMETVIVEVPNPRHPFGVRGAGEIAIVPPLAAITNAVSRAIGKRMYDIPLTPDKVLAALERVPTSSTHGR
jgi:CO/xanthine dehydrogenase Mo-binding subunit